MKLNCKHTRVFSPQLVTKKRINIGQKCQFCGAVRLWDREKKQWSEWK